MCSIILRLNIIAFYGSRVSCDMKLVEHRCSRCGIDRPPILCPVDSNELLIRTFHCNNTFTKLRQGALPFNSGAGGRWLFLHKQGP